MSLTVSAHATVRYCERALGFNPKSLEKAMAELVGDAKRGRFKVPGLDLIAVVEDRKVVTFNPINTTKPPKLPPKKSKKHRLKFPVELYPID